MMQRYDMCQDFTTAKLVLLYSNATNKCQSKLMNVLVHGEKLLSEIAGVPAHQVTRDVAGFKSYVKIVKDIKVIQSVALTT